MAGDVIIQMLTHVRAEGQVVQPVTHKKKKKILEKYMREDTKLSQLVNSMFW